MAKRNFEKDVLQDVLGRKGTKEEKAAAGGSTRQEEWKRKDRDYVRDVSKVLRADYNRENGASKSTSSFQKLMRTSQRTQMWEPGSHKGDAEKYRKAYEKRQEQQIKAKRESMRGNVNLSGLMRKWSNDPAGNIEEQKKRIAQMEEQQKKGRLTRDASDLGYGVGDGKDVQAMQSMGRMLKQEKRKLAQMEQEKKDRYYGEVFQKSAGRPDSFDEKAGKERLEEVNRQLARPDYNSPYVTKGTAAGMPYAASYNGTRNALEEEQRELMWKVYASGQERKAYDYILQNEGKEAAEEFLGDTRELRNQRQGHEIAQRQDTAWKKGLYSLEAGVDQFTEGMWQLGQDDPMPVGAKQFASGEVRDSIDTFDIGGYDVGQALYDVGVNTGNMLPSMMIGSVAGGLAGAAGMGASAASKAGELVSTFALGAGAKGNAYRDARAQGYSKEEAGLYSTINGTLEGALQYVLGGISHFGGKVSGNVVSKMTKNIENVAARVAVEMGGKMGSEFTEEYLQEVLDPVVRNLALGEDNKFKPFTEEALYSGVLGAISAGILEGPSSVADTVTRGRIGSEVKNSFAQEDLIDTALKMEEGTDAYKRAWEMRQGKQKPTKVNLGDLYVETDDAVARDAFRTDEKNMEKAVPTVALHETDGETGEGIAPAQNGADARETAPMVGTELTDRTAAGEDVEENAVQDTESMEDSEGTGVENLEPSDENAQGRNDTAEVGDQPAAVKGVVKSGDRLLAAVETGSGTKAVSLDKVAFDSPEVQRVYDQAKRFGDSGAKTLVLNYKEDMPAEHYVRGMRAYYNAGNIGVEYGDVHSLAADMYLPDSVKMEAYQAGRVDRAGKVPDPAETVKSMQPGLLQNEYSTQLDEDTRNVLDAYGKLSGAGIVIEDSIAGGKANGYYDGEGNIHIALDSENPMSVVANHELTHYIQQNSELYGAYKNYVMRYLKKNYGTTTDDLIESHMDQYEKIGQPITVDEAMDEIVANASEMFFTDEEVANEVAKENPGLARKILDYVKDLVRKLKKMLEGYGPQSKEGKMLNAEMDVAREAERLWMEALRDAAGKESADGHNGTNLKKQFQLNEFGLEEYTEHEKENWSTSKIMFANNKQDIADYVKQMVKQRTGSRLYIGKIGKELAGKIKKDTGEELLNYNLAITDAFENSHAIERKEQLRGQVAITPEIIADLPEIIGKYDKVYRSGENKSGKPSITFEKDVNGKKVAVEYVSDKKKMLYLQTIYGWGKKKEDSHPGANAKASATTSKTNGDMSLHGNNIRQADEKSKGNKKNQYAYDVTLKQNKKQNSHLGANAKASATTPETTWDKSSFENNIRQTDKKGNSDQTKKLFSLKEDARGVEYYQRENEKQREIIDNLQKRLDMYHRIEPDQNAVKKVTDHILEKYKSSYPKTKAREAVGAIWDYIANSEHVDGGEVLQMTDGLAKKILKRSTKQNNVLAEEYKDLRTALKKTRIKIDPETRKGIEYYEGYADFRRRNVGSLSLSTKEGTAVDTVYQELASQYPELFDEGKVSNTADQIIQLSDAAQMLKPFYENIYGMNLEEAARNLSYELYDAYFDINKSRSQAEAAAIKKAQRLAGEYKVKTQQYRESLKADYEKRLKAQGERYQKQQGRVADALKKQRARYAEMQERRNTGKEATRLRQQIKKNGMELSRWLISPTDKQHVPEPLKVSLLRFLTQIDFTNAKGNPDSIAMQDLKTTMETLHRQLEAAEKDAQGTNSQGFQAEFDPDLMESLNSLIDRVSGRRSLSEMDFAQLKEFDNVMTSIKRSVTRANDLYGNARFEKLSDAAMDTIKTLREKKGKKERGNLLGKADRFANTAMLDSRSFLLQLGEGGKSIYKELRDGFSRRVWDIKKAQTYMEGMDLTRQDLKDITGGKAQWHEFSLDGQQLRMTKAQIMSLYCMMKRPQAKQHILLGGFRVESMKRKGKVFNEYAEKTKTIHLDELQVREVVDTLSEREKGAADYMQRFLADECAAWGNDASLMLYGYRKFNDPNYFPIKTDSNTNRTTEQSANNAALYRIRNQGMTKSLTKGAKNAVMVEDIFDVFTKHVTNMADYHGFAVPISDAMRWFNYRDGENSVKAEMDRALGMQSQEYFIKLIQDINKVNTGSGETIGSSLMGNYKAAAIGANLRVVVQQPTAYARAVAVMNPKYLMQPVGRGAMEEMMQHSAIAQWKSWGYYETMVGKSMKEVITGQQTLSEKIKEKSMSLASMADDITWAGLWNACKAEMRDKHPELTGEAFMEAVAERFDDVIDQTQVVDTVLHRSGYMRQDGLAKMQSAFMAEPTKSYNLLRNAMADLNTDGGKTKCARAFMAFFLSSAAAAGAAALVDGLRDDDEYDAYGKKYCRAVAENMMDNINPMNMMPYLKEIPSILSGFNPSRMDLQVFVTAYNTVNTLMSAEKKPWTKAYALAKVVSQATGIPVANAMRAYESVYNSVSRTNLGEPGRPASARAEMVAYAIENGDEEMRKEITEDILGMGKDEDYIATSISKIYSKKIKEEMIAGNMQGAEGYIDSYMEAKKKFGKDEKEARASLKSSLTRKFKEKYLDGEAGVGEMLLSLKADGEALYDEGDLRDWEEKKGEEE